MKTFLSIIIAFLYVVPCYAQQELLPAFPKEISYKGDLAYFNGAPFTGLLVNENTYKPLGEFRNGYKNGAFTEYYEDGKKKTIVNYSMGIKDGVETEWYENGQKGKEATLRNGLPNGLLREWHYNGNLKTEISFSNGMVVDGEYFIFDEQGAIIESLSYKNNVILVKKSSNGKYEQFYDSGNLKYECYINEQDNQDGAFTEWWKNGSKKAEGFHKNGRLDGKLTSWDESSFKISEEYFIDNKKDGTAVYWEKGGIVRTQNFDKGVLISENSVNQANLISNITLSENEHLFYYLEGPEGKDKVFVKIKFIDKAFKNDALKRQMISNLLSSMQKRLLLVNNKKIYNDEYISFTIELFELKYFAEGEYSSTSNKTMYTGNCSFKLKLYDYQNKKLIQDKFNSSNVAEWVLLTTSYSEKDRALNKSVKKADCGDFMYKYFPVKSNIIEIMHLKDNKAKTVKISAGSEFGVKRKLNFNIYSGDLSKSSFLGELKVTEVYPTYSICKVTSGEEAVLSNFNSDIKLTIISKL